jgi:hypothetical protein
VALLGATDGGVPPRRPRNSAIRTRAKELGWPVPIHPPRYVARDVFREWARLYRRLRWAIRTDIDLVSNVRPGAKFARLRVEARQRGLPVELTLEQYTDLMTGGRCEYCGGAPPGTGHGVDRKDPVLGYTVTNVVVACDPCNRIKSDLFSYEQMREIGNLLRAWRAAGRWKDRQRKDGRRLGGRPVKGDLRQEIEAWNSRWLSESSAGSSSLPLGADADLGDGSDIVWEGFRAYSVHSFGTDLADELDDSGTTAVGSV